MSQDHVVVADDLPKLNARALILNLTSVPVFYSTDYAVETFGSTGRGFVTDVPNDCSHFSLINEDPAVHKSLSLASAKKVLHTIKTNFGTLPFARRYLERAGETNYLLGVSIFGVKRCERRRSLKLILIRFPFFFFTLHSSQLKHLVQQGIVEDYPPLADIDGS